MNSSNWRTQVRYGEYEILGARENRPRVLGQGSFGKTFEAVRTDNVGGTAIKKHVAIKVIDPELLSSQTKRFQFIQELLALSEFKHANLIHYIRCGEEKGEVYYAMELCRGGDLEKLVRRFGPVPEKVAVLIGLQVAAGLKEVHQRHRLVHRDIKPSNIMLVDELGPELETQHLAFRFEQQESLCRVVDFGLVTFTLNAGDTPQRFVGSAMYASPEQIREAPLDGRCDIYSLGMTLWYLVQGKGPLLDETGEEIKEREEAIERQTSEKTHESDLPPHLSAEFKTILMRMIAKQPEHRYATAGELQAALRQYLSVMAERVAANAVTPQNGAVLTRISEPLESVYHLEQRLSANSTHNTYAAREKAGGQLVRVSVVAGVETGDAAQRAEQIAGRLCKLAELSRQPTRPEALLPVRAVVWASDLLAYTEELHRCIALSEFLKARTNAKRPVAFPESMAILRPIAEALDYLLQHGQDEVSLACEQIWLTGPVVDSLPADASPPIAPLPDWDGLQVRFSMMHLKTEAAEIPETGSSSVANTISGSAHMSASDAHPVPVFARLIYRILNGTEVAAAVQFAPYAYVPAVTLSFASNNLIRDTISRQRPWIDAVTFLKDLCAKEGVVWRSGLAATTVRTASSEAVVNSDPASESPRGDEVQAAPATDIKANEGAEPISETIPVSTPDVAESRAESTPKAEANENRVPAAAASQEDRPTAAEALATKPPTNVAVRDPEPPARYPTVFPSKLVPIQPPQPAVVPSKPPSRAPLLVIALLVVAALGIASYFGYLLVKRLAVSKGDGPPVVKEASTPSNEAKPEVRPSSKPDVETVASAAPPAAVHVAAETPAAIPVASVTPVAATPAKATPKPMVTLADFSEALAKNPNDVEALLGRGDYFLKKNDAERARADFTKAMVVAPEDPRPLIRRGRAWASTGSFLEGNTDLQAALKIDPRNAEAHLGMGEILMARRDYTNAIGSFTAALLIEPAMTDAILNRARCFRYVGAIDRAIADYDSYVQRKQDDPKALSQYSWLLATTPNAALRNGVKAKEYGFLANKLTGWQVADYLDTYAAALAETGNFEEAVKCENEAITRAAREKEEYRNQLQSRMDLYSQKKPYRQGTR